MDDFLKLINSLVDEKAEIYVTKKFSIEEEAEWLLEVIARLERDEDFFLAAEVDKKVGFIEIGIIPERHFRQGKLIDENIMKKQID